VWKNFPGIISAAIVQHPIDWAKLKLFFENKKLILNFSFTAKGTEEMTELKVLKKFTKNSCTNFHICLIF